MVLKQNPVKENIEIRGLQTVAYGTNSGHCLVLYSLRAKNGFCILKNC